MDFKYESNRIYLEDNGKLLAEVTFPLKDNVAVIDHTFVDESLRGQGIASKLVSLAVEEISRNGWKLEASCPYAIKWIREHL